mmetsp:Transcript_133756/g.286034  ORF Transcript_133756/g.286034 Transcript_133756/m.286034 type:complete len:516 (+) Transcript_133756:98-1645(+)
MSDGTSLIVDFWEEFGLHLVAPFLNVLNRGSLGAACRQLSLSAFPQEGEAWRFTAEVTPALRSSASMQARSLCSQSCSATIPVIKLTLPHEDLLQALPRRLAARAAFCPELIFDFGPVVAFQERCSHSSVLTRDPWQHVVLKLLLDPCLLDRSLQRARCGFPKIEILRIANLLATRISKMVEQPANAKEPLAFPVLRHLPHFTRLRVLQLESARTHPDFVSMLSSRAFDALVFTVLPELPLEELALATFLVEGEGRGRSVADLRDARPMPVEPFLHLSGLRKLRLAAVAYCGATAIIGATTPPLLLDLSRLPGLEELDLCFLAAPAAAAELGGGITCASASSSMEPLGARLRRLRLTGLGSGPMGLSEELGRRLAACPGLEELRLSGRRLEVDFLRGFLDGLEGSQPAAQGGRAPLLLEWTWSDPAAAAAAASAASLPIMRCVATALARQGGVLQVAVDLRPPLDPRLSCEDAAAMEQRPTDGLHTFGEGMEWFLGGVPPTGLTVEQHAVISNRE